MKNLFTALTCASLLLNLVITLPAKAVEFAFVVNSDSNNVTVFEDEAITTTFNVDDNPYGIVVNPSSTRAYVSNYISGTINVIDLTTEGVYPIIHTIDLGSATGLWGMSMNSNGSLLAVACYESPGSVKFINTSTYAIITVDTGDTSQMADVAILPQGGYAYATDAENGTVVVIDLNSFTIVDTIDVGDEAAGIISNHTGTQVYVAVYGIDALVAINTSTNIASVATTVLNIYDLAISPDDAFIYTVGYEADTVSTIATNTFSIVDSVIIDPHPSSIAINEDGTLLLVSQDSSNKAAFINASDLSDYTQHDVGLLPSAVAFANAAISSPTHLSGEQKPVKFLSQTDLVNVLKWSAPTTGTRPVSYAVYRNEGLTDLAGTVSANSPLVFKDHNRKKNTIYTYYVVSVDSHGNQSPAAFITVPNNGVR